MKLTAGTSYTLKMKSSALFNFSSISAIKDRVSLLVSGTAEVLSVERPILTQYYLVRVQMLRAQDSGLFTGLVRQAFVEMGFNNAVVLDIERGQTTTNIVKEAARESASSFGAFLAPAGDVVTKIVWGVAVSLSLGAVLYIWVRRQGQ